jgi:integrase
LKARRSLWYVREGKWELTPPKTQRGLRTIPLSGEVVQALQRHRAKQAAARLKAGPHWQDHEFIFCDELGAPLSMKTLARGRFRRLLKKAGCPAIRLYDLRHTCATLLMEDPLVTPNDVQELWATRRSR